MNLKDMKKTYIAPSTEIEMTQVVSLMAVSLDVVDATKDDTADSRVDLNIWDEDEE